jgi:PAS domain S-box-containing protein
MQDVRGANDKVNVLLVDDQPAKLLANEEILRSLGENLIKASSAREALEFLLKNEAAVVLVDVCMPELDGFQLAAMIREHPRFQRTAIIFISAVQVDDVDRLRGYEMGAVDYVPVPVVPAVLRAKVKIFAELYRKTRQLELLNAELERRVSERTAELVASNARLRASEQGRSLALAAGQMGSWDWDLINNEWIWDEGQCRIFGVDPASFKPTAQSVADLVNPQDMSRLNQMIVDFRSGDGQGYQTEFQVRRPDGAVRRCFGTAAPTFDDKGRVIRVSGVTIDITERKEAEVRQDLLAREVDHRARNALAIVQSIVRLTRANSVEGYVAAVEGRIKALGRAHALLSDARWHSADLGALVAEELAPYRVSGGDKVQVSGPDVALPPHMAQGLALALHELATNAAKHGALSSLLGKLSLSWQLRPDYLVLQWTETGGPAVSPPSTRSFGLKVIRTSIENQLNGKAIFEWSPPGMQCTLAIPLGKYGTAREPQPADRGAPDSARPQSPSGQRVLLVEDEALVAMMIQDWLAEAGHSVIGPISRASEALQAATEADYDAAILDINLGDGMAYPVADIVAKRGVPFVFVTGYEADTIDDRFSHVPILQKPIERQMLQGLFLSTALAPNVVHVNRGAAPNARLGGGRPRAKRA